MKKSKVWVFALALLCLCGCQQEAEAVEETVTGQEIVTEEAQEESEEAASKPFLETVQALDFTLDYELFEEHFYGSWSGENTSFKLLYDEPSDDDGAWVMQGVAEDEESWYLSAVSGGAGQVLRIAKDEPEVMYYYDVWYSTEERTMEQYDDVLYPDGERSDYSADYPLGQLSYLGIQKLNAELDHWLGSDLGTVVLDDGSQWWNSAASSRATPAPTFYLLEEPTADKIHYVCQMYPDGYNADEQWPDRNYLYPSDIEVTVERIDGAWKVTSANHASLEDEMFLMGRLESVLDLVWDQWVISAPAASDDPIFVDNRRYQPVTNWFWQDAERLMAYLEATFTEDCARSIVDNAIAEGNVRIMEGTVYSTNGGKTGNLEAGRTDVEIEYLSETTAALHFTCYRYDQDTNTQTNEVLETYTIPAVLTEKGWRLEELYRP